MAVRLHCFTGLCVMIAAAVRRIFLRGAFGVFMLVALIMAWLDMSRVGAAGLGMFGILCVLNIVAATLAAVTMFATCVTEESEGGNSGLLKLAGMNAFSILLAKSTSRLISALMLLLVQFPFTLLAVTLGGVTLIQVVSAYCAIGAYLILVANVGMFFSVCSRTSGRAAAWTAVALVVGFTGTSVITFVTANSSSPAVRRIQELWLQIASNFSVVGNLERSLSSAFTGPVLSRQVLFSIGAAVVLFVISCLGFERGTNRQSEPGRLSQPRGRGGVLARTLGVSRAWRYAIAWKEFYFLTGGRVMWAFRWFALLLLMAGILSVTGGETEKQWNTAATTFSLCLQVVVVAELVAYASRILFDEVRWRTLPVLLILPISSRRLMVEKVAGCAIALVPTLSWLTFALCLDSDLRDGLNVGLTIQILINLAILLHLTILFSLRARWAALPLAAMVVFALNACCPVLMVSGMVLQTASGRIDYLAPIVVVATYWLLLLLPLELEILNKVENAGEQEF